MTSAPAKAGLEDVIACTSAICDIDGLRGKLYYRGYDIDDLVGESFEAICYLLWEGELPSAQQLADLRAAFAGERRLPDEVVELLRRLPPSTHPLAALRTAVSALGALDPDGEDGSPEANRRKSRRLTVQAPLIVGAFNRLRQGVEPVPPVASDSVA